MDAGISKIINKALDGNGLDEQEIAALFKVEDLSEEAFAIQYAGRMFSESLLKGKAEVHAQVGVNAGPCRKDCQFCSFAASNKVFFEQKKESHEDVIKAALQLEADGVNALYLMSTANYEFEEFLELGRQVRAAMKTSVPLISNYGDINDEEAKALKEAGFAGIYHAIRLGEGEVTRCNVDDRWKTVEAAHDAGLLVGTCLEPVAPEHSIEELVEKTVFTREMDAVFSGAGRRVSIPTSPLAKYGVSTYARMATIVAAVGLATGTAIGGNCTHEPNELGVYAGANLIWAEKGSNPRDTKAETDRGWTIASCRELYRECGWEVLDGPSQMYA